MPEPSSAEGLTSLSHHLQIPPALIHACDPDVLVAFEEQLKKHLAAEDYEGYVRMVANHLVGRSLDLPNQTAQAA